MEAALRPLPTSTPDEDPKNRIRACLTTAFSDRDCHLLYRPLSDEKRLRDLHTVPYEQLRPQFRGQLEELVRKVHGRARAKAVEGQPVSGGMLRGMVEAYVDAINREAIPTIATTWERVIEGEVRRVFEKAIGDLEFFLKQIIGQRFPMEE